VKLLLDENLSPELIETFLNSAKETCLVLSVAAKKPVHRVE
jgi:hypothetical protein